MNLLVVKPVHVEIMLLFILSSGVRAVCAANFRKEFLVHLGAFEAFSFFFVSEYMVNRNITLVKSCLATQYLILRAHTEFVRAIVS